ncbi:hypothetical protein MSAN_02333400 [Mycena sanguinolenta]|uniref:Secreted protein n=1 Tax=Mycena sanguinolenta TaxID=230812 RepID=A0A8H7CFC2_9AGAR|nr:hypothetical protein MSAN_02333400 [Mycena sanguinolenta]
MGPAPPGLACAFQPAAAALVVATARAASVHSTPRTSNAAPRPRACPLLVWAAGSVSSPVPAPEIIILSLVIVRAHQISSVACRAFRAGAMEKSRVNWTRGCPVAEQRRDTTTWEAP